MSPTLIRMIPIAVSLLGSGVRLPTQLFLGWIGPGGLASILFALLILEGSEIAHKEQLLSITVITVAMSALLYGVSAAPIAKRFGRLVDRLGECEETILVTEMPMREGHLKADNNQQGTFES